MVSGSILISRGGEVLLAKGFGLADREHGAANTESMPFRLASVSKSITAVVVLQLLDRSLLDLDATLDHFIVFSLYEVFAHYAPFFSFFIVAIRLIKCF
jgi:CubicO group peptidase (beta-lactamase class C family)